MTKSETIHAPVAGYESQVRSLRGKLRFLQQLQKEVDAAKGELRDAAKTFAVQANVTGLEFLDPEGDGSILVTLLDYNKAGNRTQLSAKAIAAFEAAGIRTEQLEVERHLELRGEYVDWLLKLIEQWQAQGVQLPTEGLTVKENTKLSAACVSELHKRTATGDVAAREILDQALKSSSVSVR